LKEFIKLLDLTVDYAKPCILDIKLGSRAYNPEKLEHQAMKIKESTSGSLGFRISGLTVNRRSFF